MRDDEPWCGTGIGPAELEARLVPELCARATFAEGDELRRKGDHYSDMYLIVKGRVDVLLDGRANPVVMGPGSPVGEIGFLRGCAATGTAVAREETTALVIDDATLWRIERESPVLSVSLLQALADTAELRLNRDAELATEQESADDLRVEILLCRNDAMLEQAMRIRYRVYCDELGRSSPYADHDRKVIRDNLDDFGHTFIAVDDGRAIGTLRANFSAEGALGTLEEIYGMSASPNHPDYSMICTKFIVEKARRGGSVSTQLIRAMAVYALKARARECFIDCIPSLVPLYRRIGFVPAGKKFFHYENGPSLPMVMDLTRHAERLSRRAGR